MKTEISDFCKDYSSALIPAGAALDAVIEQIEHDSQEDVLRLSLAGLNEVKHRLKSLIDKVEGQQAYLLIFGPLKSGKSTLMNAISGAYVSEVTSLPAYPCLVYVRHGDKASIKLTRYNGRETATEDKNVMEVLINDSHSNLADRIRTVEEAGREFDPGLDYPEAIRRIDIDLTAHELNDSGTVLVDTPGLYSRMKFGYDLMTREFRNSAACAVFVVKTDNLFLEQVFEEFNDLLGLFSRVFLVVNIDSSKRDLRPDGSLQPSLESQNPQKIIDAFQLLSMSAGLRKASRDGRLKIYPIDLLNAASQHLQAANGGFVEPSPSEAPVAPPVEEEARSSSGEDDPSTEVESLENGAEDQEGLSEAEALRARSGRPNDFKAFLSDLTEYLNSSDYLFELMSDSFRQGDALRDEVLRNCEADAIQDFVVQQRRLRSEVVEIDGQLEAIKSLAGFDWEKAFEGTHADVEQAATQFAKEVREDLEKALKAGIENWFETADCLGDLVGKTWQSRIDELQKQIAEKTAKSVKNVLDSSSGGARPSSDIVIALDRVRLSLREVYNHSISALRELPKVSPCSIEVDVNDLPVNRTFWDRIFFQSQAKVRRRLLGGGSELRNEIPPTKKRKRLLPDGKLALEKTVDDQLEGILPGIPHRCSRDFLKVYVDRFKRDFANLLKSRQSELEESKQNLEQRIEANDRISGAFDGLDVAISALSDEMTALRNKFLRSARLARGFQILESPIGAFSLWTTPYLGGMTIVPQTALQVAEAPSLEGLEEVQEDVTDAGTVVEASEEAGIGAFTIWTAEHLGIDPEAGEEATEGPSGSSLETTDEQAATESVLESADEGLGANESVRLPSEGEASEAPDQGPVDESSDSEEGKSAQDESVEGQDAQGGKPLTISIPDPGGEDSEDADEGGENSQPSTPLRVVPKATDQ